MNDTDQILHTGSQDGYEWLVLKEWLRPKDIVVDVAQLCPDVVLGKYVAVTSFDSGPLGLNESEKSAGWTTSGGIAYSPKIQDIDAVPREYFSEFYILESPRNLGELADRAKNIFECQMEPPYIHTFVNFYLGLHDSAYTDLIHMFWQQFEWIKPESYLAENDYVTFVTKNQKLFASVREGLRSLL